MRPALSSLVTEVPSNWAPRNPTAPEALITMVCGEPRRIAKPYLRGERRQPTLQKRRIDSASLFSPVRLPSNRSARAGDCPGMSAKSNEQGSGK